RGVRRAARGVGRAHPDRRLLNLAAEAGRARRPRAEPVDARSYAGSGHGYAHGPSPGSGPGCVRTEPAGASAVRQLRTRPFGSPIHLMMPCCAMEMSWRLVYDINLLSS